MTNNSNINEINKFNDIADEWWNINGKFRALHAVNPLRTHYIVNQVANLANKKVLDVGCGGGILSESLAKLGALVTGIDLADDSLAVAKNHAENNHLSINYIKTSVESFADANEAQFDIITCMELLEHVPSPASIINAIAKLLKPGGKLFVSTINRNLKARLMMIYGAEYIAKLVPMGTHDFNHFIRPSELMDMIDDANLTTTDIAGIEYQLLKNQFKLSDDVSVNYIMLATKTH